MARYLVKGKPKIGRLKDLKERLNTGEIVAMRPFGSALNFSLKNSKVQEDGYALWEEEDYCSPPLAQERRAVLDYYFDDLSVERVQPDRGWKRIASLPSLWGGSGTQR